MSQGTVPRRGWSVLGLALGLAALGALFGVLNHFQPAGSIAVWSELVTGLAFSVPAAVIIGYRPANPIGWILCTMGLTHGVTVWLGYYSDYALRTNPGSMPGGVLAAWLQSLFWFPVIGLVPLLLLLVPNGSLPSPRWRPVAWVPAAAPPSSLWLAPLAPARSAATPAPALRRIRWGSSRPARFSTSPKGLASW